MLSISPRCPTTWRSFRDHGLLWCHLTLCIRYADVATFSCLTLSSCWRRSVLTWSSSKASLVTAKKRLLCLLSSCSGAFYESLTVRPVSLSVPLAPVLVRTSQSSRHTLKNRGLFKHITQTRQVAVYLETRYNIGSKRAFPTGVLRRWHNCLLIYWRTSCLVPAFDKAIFARCVESHAELYITSLM